jgi:exodeoxyribonuclease-3
MAQHRAMRIATWNINSVRLRIDQVSRYAAMAKPDVLCLQEIKCLEAEFPYAAFKDMGLKYVHVVGQKGAHGVAIASRKPIESLPSPGLCPFGEARVAVVKVAGINVLSLYIPAGGEDPDVNTNAKFAHKLAFLDRMNGWCKTRPGTTLLTGDLNIAPGEHDVWNHKQLLDVVSHTPVETSGLNKAREAGAFVDLMRAARPEPEKLFTWWSYRNADWKVSNRGRRLDHIWSSPDIAPALKKISVWTETRDWSRPSDHVPVMAELEL